MNHHLLLILAGGLGVPTAVFLTARALVYRHGNPGEAVAYLAWFREQKAREQATTNREVYRAYQRAHEVRQKELTR